jgi:son of sevenless-like protein
VYRPANNINTSKLRLLRKDNYLSLKYAFEIKHVEPNPDVVPKEKEDYVFIAKDLHQKNAWKVSVETQINIAIDEQNVVMSTNGKVPSGEAYFSAFSYPGTGSATSSSSILSGSLSSHASSVSSFEVGSTLESSPSDNDLDSDVSTPPMHTPRSASDSSISSSDWTLTSNDNYSAGEEEEMFEELEELAITDTSGPQMIQTEDGVMVKAASVSFVTWFLLYGDLTDTPLIQAFLFKYRTFLSAPALFGMLMDICDNNNPPKEMTIKYSNLDTRRKVATFVTIWVSNFFLKDFDNRDLYLRVLEFLDKLLASGQVEESNTLKLAILKVNKERITKRVEKRKKQYPSVRVPSADSITSKSSIPASLPAPLDIGNKFLEFKLDSVAEHLTYVDHMLFQQVQLSELASIAWTDPKLSKKLAPNIIMSTQKFNTLSQWVSTEIVTGSNPKQRALMIERFVTLAQKCVEMRNFHTSMEILAGINRGFVDRLKKSWNHVSSSTLDTLQSLNDLMDPKHNFKNYREALRKAAKPCLPYFGIYLRDIIFTEEGNKDKLPGDWVNFEKIQMLGKIYKEILTFQHNKYPMCEDDEISQFFKQLCVMPDEVLHAQSRQLEPSPNAKVSEGA